MKRSTNKSLVAAVAVAATAVGMSACGSGNEDAGSQGADGSSLKKVTFNLAYQPQGSLGGIFAAMQEGYYREEGLEVETVPGYGGTRTVNEIAHGKWDFGYGDPISVALNRDQGGDAVMVGAVNTRWPGGLCYDADKHDIESIEDLQGLTIGAGTTSPSQQVIPAWLEQNGFAADHVELLKMDFAAIDSSLISGRIDVDDCWQASNRANVLELAESQDMNIKWLDLSDFGLDLYGNGIATSEDLIDEDPETVRKFLAATYKGYQFMLDNPDETADLMTEMDSQLDQDILERQISEVEELIKDPDAAEEPLGWFTAEQMDSTMKLINEEFDVSADVTAEDLYTNDFLD